MKKLLNFVITLALLGALGWTLWRGLQHRREQEEEKKEEAAKAGEEKKDEPEPFVVKLEKERWKVLGLEMATPEKAELKPQRIAFGRVMDPTPLVALDGEFAAAEAALTASRAEYQRTQSLLKAGEGMSRKVAEAAEAQFRADEIKADALRRRAQIEWGAAFSSLNAEQRRAFVEQLVRGEAALVRVDLLPGDALAELPASARLSVVGRGGETIHAGNVAPAADTDPKTQAQGFVLRVEKPPFALQPGMALTAWLELSKPPQQGFALPRAAVLRHDGATWVFVQAEEEFVRKPVTLVAPLDGGKGWFIAAEGGIAADEHLVVAGAQALLSEELKAQGGGEKE